MDNKKCYQWVVTGVGMAYQPECSKEKCMWWNKCKEISTLHQPKY